MDPPQTAVPATQTVPPKRRFPDHLGGKRGLWSAIVAMGTRWRRTASSQPANIIMNNAWLRAEGYILFYQLLSNADWKAPYAINGMYSGV